MPIYQRPIKTISSIIFLRNQCSVKLLRWEPVGGVAAWLWLFKAVLDTERCLVLEWGGRNRVWYYIAMVGIVWCVTDWLCILLQWYILNRCSYVWLSWPAICSNESFLCPLLKVLTSQLLYFNPDIVICHVSLFLCPPAPGAHIKLPRFHFKAAPWLGIWSNNSDSCQLFHNFHNYLDNQRLPFPFNMQPDFNFCSSW